MNSALNPSSILQTAFGFWESKVLLTAVELGVFTKLASRRLTGAELGAELQFHPRAIADFFDALVAMKFLGRDDAFDYSGADFRQWCGEVGFKCFEVILLAGPSSAAVAYE